jgi:hypothetical protein
LLLPKAGAHRRALPVEYKEPHTNPGEIESFIMFHEHGLGHTVHPFLLGLLNEFGVELQHLHPNGVLHITGFVTLCEGFLMIDLHVNIFRAFFHGRGLTVKGNPLHAPVGGFGLQKRFCSLGDYPAYTPTDSNQGWHE